MSTTVAVIAVLTSFSSFSWRIALAKRLSFQYVPLCQSNSST